MTLMKGLFIEMCAGLGGQRRYEGTQRLAPILGTYRLATLPRAKGLEGGNSSRGAHWGLEIWKGDMV